MSERSTGKAWQTSRPPAELSGVTEIRVHGVGGSSPIDLLEDPSPQQVSGDRIAGFYRTKDRDNVHVEAYSWGGLTSRSRFRVLWLLLLPFMLANLAGWMADPRTPKTQRSDPAERGVVSRLGHRVTPDHWWPSADDPAPPTSSLYRWMARVAGLAVTGNILTVIALGTVDVLAYQCGGTATCVANGWWLAPLGWGSLAEYPARRILIGALLACVAILIFALLSFTSRRRYERIPPPTKAHEDGETAPAERVPPTSTAAALPGGLQHPDFWAGKDSHARLSRQHLAFAVSTVALILAYCADAISAANTANAFVESYLRPAVWIIGIAVLVGVVVLVGIDPKNQWTSGFLVAGSLVAFAGAAVFAWVQDPGATVTGHLPGLQDAFLVSWLLTLGLMLPLLIWPALQFAYRRTHSHGNRPYSPHFGWGAPFVVASAGLILADMVLLAVIVALAYFLGTIQWTELVDKGVRDPIFLFPATNLAITLVLVCSAVVLIGAVAIGLGGYLRAGGTPNASRVRWSLLKEYGVPNPPAETNADRKLWWISALWPPRAPGDNGSQPRISDFVRGIARWRFLAAHTRRVLYVLTALVAMAVVLIIAIQTGSADWLADRTQSLARWVIPLVVLIPPAIMGFMLRSWSRVENRKAIGVLWDVGTFWPRSFHPFAPPSYAERAVPELLRRIWWLQDNQGRVLLAGHSQGSVLSAAAMLRKSERAPSANRTTALVTFGSPVQKLYRWAFPAYLNDEQLVKLARSGQLSPAEAADPTAIVGVTWRNFYYLTDVIGGPVVPKGLTARCAAICAPVDVELPDPSRSTYLYGQPEPAVGGHSGYWQDKEMWRQVSGLEEELRGQLGQMPRSPSRLGQRVAAEKDGTPARWQLVTVISLLPLLFSQLSNQLSRWRARWDSTLRWPFRRGR
ncbi:MAG: hypothetical protein ABJD68_00705 [Nakamurella sp.]